MNISSLLCSDDGPQGLTRPTKSTPTPSHSPPSRQSPPVPEPIILAPHLRGSHTLHSQQRVHQKDIPSTSPSYDNRDGVHDHLPPTRQYIGQRSFSPDARESTSLGSSKRSAYLEREELITEAPRSSHSVANYPYSQQQQRQLPLEPIPLLYGRTSHSQQRQPSETYHSRPSSSQSHSRSPTVPQFPTAQAGQPSSLSRIAAYSPPFSSERRSPPPLSSTSQRGPPSPLSSYYPRGTVQHQQPHHSTSSHPHSHSPVQTQSTSASYPFPATASQSPAMRGAINPSPPYAQQPAHVSSSSRSPVVQKQQSPYVGLEALIHAASQEQQRLNGNDSSADDRRSSRSPVVERGSGHDNPVSPHRPQQQEERRGNYGHDSANARYPQADHDHDQRRNSALYAVDTTESRPIKKQRLSDSSSGSAPHEERDKVFTSRHAPGTNAQPTPIRLSGPGAPSYTLSDRAMLGLETSRSPEEERIAPRKTSSSSVTSRSAEVPHRAPSTESKKSTSRPLTPRTVEAPQPMKPIPTTMQNKVQQPQVKTKEPDAHEWLLQEYSGNSPSPSSVAPSASMAKVRGGRPPSAPGSRQSAERPHSRTPAPEIANALERELEDVVVPSKREADIITDPDDVLDLVAQSLDNDEGASSSHRTSMEVDDELLSLVDDRPAPQPAPPRQFAPPPPTLRLSKPLTPTVVTVNSPVSFGPSGPHSPYHPTPTPASERGSMPPPVTTNVGGKGAAMKKADGESASKGKKAAAPKAAAKPKQPAKPRAKAASKSKAKPIADDLSPAPTGKGSKASPMPASAIKKSSAAATVAASRSRSTSAMPGGSVAPEGDNKSAEKDQEPEAEEDEENDDDKLYCVCKTKYNEDRVMIACDRCDEWYHTQCVKMPDLEVDLVDQFFCPLCIERNPQLNLQTTYRKRCYRGLEHPNPNSPDACHKPSRGHYSKYCSDQCGVEFMKSKIASWAKKGGNKDKLWESVRHSEKREGVVVRADGMKDEKRDIRMDVDGDNKRDVKPLVQINRVRIERDIERLHSQLDQIMQQRDVLKKEMDVILWRERLVELATERSERVDECAWDQRLCFGDEEFTDFGTEVLASYEDNAEKENLKQEGDDAMQVDNANAEEGEWWCRGKKKCDRHAGWQKLRAAEVEFEKEMKDAVLLKLTTKEREIRKRIEDILEPQGRTPPPSTPLKAVNGKQALNGHNKARPNGDVKKGKKKKT